MYPVREAALNFRVTTILATRTHQFCEQDWKITGVPVCSDTMASPGRKGAREMTKRTRCPSKKLRFFEQNTDVQLHDQGLFVFLTFEDGYTAKIFKSCDLLKVDESPIGSFKELTPGDKVLARWSDNKFYNATIEYVGEIEQNQDEKKGARKDMKKNNQAAQRFYSLSSQPSTAQHPYPKMHLQAAGQSFNEYPPAQTQFKPPYIPALARTQSPPPIPFWNNQPVYSQPVVLPGTSDQTQKQSEFLNLDEHQRQGIPSNPSCKESFLEVSFCPSVNDTQPHLPPFVESANQNIGLNMNDEHSNPSSADTVILERHPSPECGILKEFSQTGPNEARPWEPCSACRQEVQAMMAERWRMKEMLSSINIEQLQAVRDFLDQVEEHKGLDSGLPVSKPRPGQHELYPDSGLFLSSTRLTAIHQEAKRDCLRLFHLLFEEFFTPEECINSVPFGKHGKVPEGKKRLNKSKVDGILSKY
ncbi:hypothetical protein SRHO_G00242930 [Serrasalmus rhombeus]